MLLIVIVRQTVISKRVNKQLLKIISCIQSVINFPIPLQTIFLSSIQAQFHLDYRSSSCPLNLSSFSAQNAPLTFSSPVFTFKTVEFYNKDSQKLTSSDCKQLLNSFNGLKTEIYVQLGEQKQNAVYVVSYKEGAKLDWLDITVICTCSAGVVGLILMLTLVKNEKLQLNEEQ
ncbi:Hypothetical_protein [Hexamita inflata]|uniref:Hypothetical_protein n=1 Tax=Hexamita inflata TaxID=28002 RepID=A0AA86U9N6_9EUKA|nr:Hypothetical protein HINF_LOCUS22083 [Hexamita inflata]